MASLLCSPTPKACFKVDGAFYYRSCACRELTFRNRGLAGAHWPLTLTVQGSKRTGPLWARRSRDSAALSQEVRGQTLFLHGQTLVNIDEGAINIDSKPLQDCR